LFLYTFGELYVTKHLTVVCDTRFACQRLCCICTEICRVTVWCHSSLGCTADRYVVVYNNCIDRRWVELLYVIQCEMIPEKRSWV